MKTTKVLDESNVIDFNNILVNGEEYEFLKNLYLTYHRRAYIYKNNFEIFSAINVSTNIFLSIISSAAIVTAITVAPIVSMLGVASIVSMGVQKGLKFDQKIDRSRLIFNMYNELLIKLRSYIGGASYNRDDLITEIYQMELFLNDLGVIPLKICEKKYMKKHYVQL